MEKPYRWFINNKKLETIMKIKNIKKTILLLVALASKLSAQEDMIYELENTLLDMGAQLDFESVPQAQDFREAELVPLQQQDIYLYQQYIQSTQEWQESLPSNTLEIPTVDEILDIATRYQSEGIDAVIEYPIFQSNQPNSLSTQHQCTTYVPEMLFSISKFLDPENTLNLQEQLIYVFSQPVQEGSTIESILGEDWQVEAAFEGNEEEYVEGEASFYFLQNWIEDSLMTYQQQDNDDEPYEEAPVLFSHLPNPMVIKEAKPRDRTNSTIDFLNVACRKLEDDGVNADAWMTYEKHSEFTIHYRLCGNNGVSSDLYERVINKVYLMPNWSVVDLDRCASFSKTCAPMHVQMIAENIMYERKVFQQAGFRLPGHWNINIDSNNPQKGASAFLGNISLNGPAQSSRGLRNLTFHEYFHAIETMYGSELDFLFNGNLFGSLPSFERNTSWWSQLESLADWAIYALSFGDNPWPTYYNATLDGPNPINDARSHLFESSYHPLEYGYLAERFSTNGNTKISSCQGCDSIKLYLEILNGEPYGAKLWQQSYIALHSFLEMMKTGIRPTTGYEIGSLFSFNRFSQDLHLDLLFSAMNRKWATTSGDFRFFNRMAPKTSSLWPELTSWPPAMQTIPTSMQALFGHCSNNNSMNRNNAQRVDSKFIYGFSCDMKISPTGAIYLDIPLDSNNLPDKIMITGIGVKLQDDEINAYRPQAGELNYRTKAGEFINGNLRVFTVPTEINSANTFDYNKIKALSLYGNMARDKSYTISLKNQHPTSNHLYLLIDYPFLSPEWLKAPNGNRPQRDNFMARIAVAASWDN
jgi:hypothetical protein